MFHVIETWDARVDVKFLLHAVRVCQDLGLGLRGEIRAEEEGMRPSSQVSQTSSL